MRSTPLIWLALTACSGGGEDGPARPFPAGFHWGSATAGFQVDMGCPTWSDADCLDTASDWYQWVTDPGIVADSSLYVSGEDVRRGPGMWETFEEDAVRMHEQGLNAYRMSLEWSRLFPDGAAEQATTVDELAAYADADAVARYHAMFAALEEQGIHPLVTLNHYTMPVWVHDGVACHTDITTCEADGWVTEERILRLIALYAGFCGQEFGGEVDQWATLNEPMATVLSGYLFPGRDRSAPPGLSGATEPGLAVLQNQIVGSARMYDAVHLHDTVDADGDGEAASVGLVLNMTAIAPRDPDDPGDQLAAEHMDYLYHRLFFDGLVYGSWDADLDGEWDETREDLVGRVDFLGINYYNRVPVADVPLEIIDGVPIADFFPEVTWDPYPEGLGEVVLRAAEYGLPIIVSENGTPHVELAGPDILQGHLEALQSAIEQGADVRGYYYWSFVDNYEWNHGLDMRFGLYELPEESKERVPRDVLETYQDIIERGGFD